jgi:hypothetical protein
VRISELGISELGISELGISELGISERRRFGFFRFGQFRADGVNAVHRPEVPGLRHLDVAAVLPRMLEGNGFWGANAMDTFFGGKNCRVFFWKSLTL